MLNIPGTPSFPKKKLRVLPFLTKNFNHTEYLVDNSKQLHNTITSVNIAELLAGVPWSIQRLRHHIVNETAQALHKVLIFNNQHNTPFQKWDQGLWFSQWITTQGEEHVCTLYVSIAAPETKIRIRKGRNIGRRNIPTSIQPILLNSKTELIQDVAELGDQWQDMAGGGVSSRPCSQQPAPTTAKIPFSVLSDLRRQSTPLEFPKTILMKGDKLTIATHNTRGLGHGFAGHRKRREIRDLFKQTTPPTDILLLQEVKLPEVACLKQTRTIEFRKGVNLWNEALCKNNQVQRGTCIIISEQLTNSIMSHGVLYLGRTQFITLKLSPNLVIGILNVYGFSLTGPRAMLWNHLAQAELPEAHWILAGDFNNTEQATDKQGGSTKTCISRRELEAWNRLMMKLRGRDAHHTSLFVRRSDKLFTWSNAHIDHTLIQSRIDRFYIPIRIEQIGETTEILPTLPDISDHTRA